MKRLDPLSGILLQRGEVDKTPALRCRGRCRLHSECDVSATFFGGAYEYICASTIGITGRDDITIFVHCDEHPVQFLHSTIPNIL